MILSDTSPAPEKPGKYLYAYTSLRRPRSIYTHFSGTRGVYIHLSGAGEAEEAGLVFIYTEISLILYSHMDLETKSRPIYVEETDGIVILECCSRNGPSAPYRE